MVTKLQDTIILALLRNFGSALKASEIDGWSQTLDVAMRYDEDKVSVIMENEFKKLMQKGSLT